MCTALERDDAFIEYVTLQNLTGNYEKAYELLCSRKLHPWEGGEGKAAAQYITALTEMAKEKIRGKDYRQAKELLSRALIYFGEQHLRDEVKIDYFAVSLPDLMIYEEDFTLKNRAHCSYVMGLGSLGLGKKAEAAAFFEETLKTDPFHLNCRILLRECGE